MQYILIKIRNIAILKYNDFGILIYLDIWTFLSLYNVFTLQFLETHKIFSKIYTDIGFNTQRKYFECI